MVFFSCSYSFYPWKCIACLEDFSVVFLNYGLSVVCAAITNCLLTFPSSLFAGFMRRHVGWLAKLSLWSFRVIKTCCFAICSVRLSMLSSWAIDFACESMMLAASVLAFL